MATIRYHEDEKMWEIDDHDYGMEIWKDGIVTGHLGNFTDTGWYWDFDTDGFLLAIARMPSETKTEFFSLLRENIPISVIRRAIKNSIEGEGLDLLAYHLAGDNLAFKFGESFANSDDIAHSIEEAIESVREDPCIIRKYGKKFIDWLKRHYDDVWTYYNGEDKDAIIEDVKRLLELYRKQLEEVESYDELEELFFDILTTKNEDFLYDIDEIWMDEKTEALIKAETEWTKHYEERLNRFGIKTRRPDGTIQPLPLDGMYELRESLCVGD